MKDYDTLWGILISQDLPNYKIKDITNRVKESLEKNACVLQGRTVVTFEELSQFVGELLTKRQ